MLSGSGESDIPFPPYTTIRPAPWATKPSRHVRVHCPCAPVCTDNRRVPDRVHDLSPSVKGLIHRVAFSNPAGIQGQVSRPRLIIRARCQPA